MLSGKIGGPVELGSMTVHGTSRRFAAMQQHVGYRGKADSDAASTRQIYGFTA